MRRVARTVSALVIAGLTAGAGVTLPLGARRASDASAATRPQVGFSFSPRTASWLGEEPTSALQELMAALSPDLVRLPVYWDGVEPFRGTFDYREVDRLLGVVRAYNRDHRARSARVILEVGARNMGYPELYVPAWLPAAERSSAAQAVSDSAYVGYLETSVRRYRHDPLLYSWQLENEPLDDVPSSAGAPVDVPGDALQEELEALRAVDPAHEVVITTYNSSTLSLDLAALAPESASRAAPAARPAGHPLQALQLGDALGLDLYVVTGDTALQDAGAAKRTDWKKAALDYWVEQGRSMHKQLWITEMQGAPWPGHSDFSPLDLLYSAGRYRQTAASVVLLWGVESWLQSPSWIAAGIHARRVLGS